MVLGRRVALAMALLSVAVVAAPAAAPRGSPS